jgi:hypothetical protein
VPDATETPAPEAPPPPPLPPWRRWIFAALPALALLELAAQFVTQAWVPTDAHWRAARDWIARNRRDGDLVTSAPLWTDPLARMHLREFISLRDAARPDATRYRRALVATIRGGENPDLRGWTQRHAERLGPITVRVMENPAPATVRYDFVDNLRPPDAEVFRAMGEERAPCTYRDGFTVSGGGLGQGALAGRARYVCNAEGWNYVGVTHIEDMQHRGRRCIWSHPVQGGVMITRYPQVPLGSTIHGHHGIAYEAERGDDNGNQGGPVSLIVKVDGQPVGEDIHRDNDGWRLFEMDTRRFAGGTHEVVFEVRAENAGMRHYCFEGDAR